MIFSTMLRRTGSSCSAVRSTLKPDNRKPERSNQRGKQAIRQPDCDHANYLGSFQPPSRPPQLVAHNESWVENDSCKEGNIEIVSPSEKQICCATNGADAKSDQGRTNHGAASAGSGCATRTIIAAFLVSGYHRFAAQDLKSHRLGGRCLSFLLVRRFRAWFRFVILF